MVSRLKMLSRSNFRLAHNGTAIERAERKENTQTGVFSEEPTCGVGVTGEAIRPVVPVVSKESVPVASRYGAIFAITTN